MWIFFEAVFDHFPKNGNNNKKRKREREEDRANKNIFIGCVERSANFLFEHVTTAVSELCFVVIVTAVSSFLVYLFLSILLNTVIIWVHT